MMSEVGSTVKRGRGRRSGPALKELLTVSYPDGATAEQLVFAGFREDLESAVKRGDVRQLDEDGCYVWVGDAASDGDPTNQSPKETSEERPGGSMTRAKVFDQALEVSVNIDIAKIKIGCRCRKLNQPWVERLKASMRILGLQNPITVAREGDGFVLIAGLHRLEAAKLLGWEKIPCVVVDMDHLTRRLWEVDENLCRAELTELERGEHLAARKEIYEQLHPDTRQHVSGAVAANAAMGRGNATDNLSVASFAADTAEKTGLDERTIRRSIRRAEHIVPEVRDLIRDMSEIANKGVELDALAKISPDRQAEVVANVKSGYVATIRAAATSRVRNNKQTDAALETEPASAAAEPAPTPITAQKWARHLAKEMSVPELRDLRDAITEILVTADHGECAGALH